MITDQLKKLSAEDWETKTLMWHRNGYTNFASVSRLERLRNKATKDRNKLGPYPKRGGNPDEKGVEGRLSAKRSTPTDCVKCIFCQEDTGEQVHSVMSWNVSNRILGLCKRDFVMCSRMADVNDLIAAEGKYHKKCLVKFERTVQRKTSNLPNMNDQASLDFQMSYYLDLHSGLCIWVMCGKGIFT